MQKRMMNDIIHDYGINAFDGMRIDIFWDREKEVNYNRIITAINSDQNQKGGMSRNRDKVENPG